MALVFYDFLTGYLSVSEKKITICTLLNRIVGVGYSVLSGYIAVGEVTSLRFQQVPAGSSRF